jgi:hypothetical protein
MEATFFSEMSVDFQRTTRRYIPDYRTTGVDGCKGENVPTQVGPTEGAGLNDGNGSNFRNIVLEKSEGGGQWPVS